MFDGGSPLATLSYASSSPVGAADPLVLDAPPGSCLFRGRSASPRWKATEEVRPGGLAYNPAPSPTTIESDCLPDGIKDGTSDSYSKYSIQIVRSLLSKLQLRDGLPIRWLARSLHH